MFSWKGKNVLITGISGFVGRHLGKTLTDKGATVYGISRKKSDKHIFKSSILNKSLLENIITKNKISIIFHLAGEALVENGQKNPYDTFKTNILGTLNILEIARIHKLDRVIISSTVHVYGKNKPPFTEEYPAKPSRPYETSKTAADLLAQSYADTFNLPVLIPRFVNIYGPGDVNFTRLVPKTMHSIFKDGHVTMWGGKAVRDYLYVDDAVSAYICLAQMDKKLIEKNRIFNFGTGKTTFVKEIIERLVIISGKELPIEQLTNGREAEIDMQYSSWKKARRILGWKPTVDINTGLKKTYTWYKTYLHK